MDLGMPAFFLRLQGCGVHCFFCDEKDTWIKRENNSRDLDIEEILIKLKSINPDLKKLIITGGEPTEQSLANLITQLIENNYDISIETAGTGSFIDELFMNYKKTIKITFSPKELYSNFPIMDSRIWSYASELKFVVANPSAANYLENRILPSLDEASNQCPIFLLPDWYNIEPNKKLILDLLKLAPNRLRMGIQAHKFMDLL